MPPVAFYVIRVESIGSMIYITIMFLLSWLIVLSGHKPRPGEPVPGPDEMSRHILSGMYYCNPNDPRGWVPKSGDPAHSNGGTINLRYRSWAIAYKAVSIAGIVILSLIGIAAPLLYK